MELSWSLVTAVNSEEVLRSTLLASEEHKFAQDVVFLRGFFSASMAYNAGMKKSSSEILVFVHQDIFLPSGWAVKLSRCIQELTAIDPQWGVAGVIGKNELGENVGFAYSSGLKQYVGKPFRHSIPVRTLDEIVLIIRRSSGLAFDEALPGFHLYGTDICLEAERKGLKNYVIPCFVFHNSCGIKRLPMEFWQAYMYLRSKWWDYLPIYTSCTKITRSCTPMFRHFIERTWLSIRGKNRPGLRISKPKQFYEECLKRTLMKDS